MVLLALNGTVLGAMGTLGLGCMQMVVWLSFTRSVYLRNWSVAYRQFEISLGLWLFLSAALLFLSSNESRISPQKPILH